MNDDRYLFRTGNRALAKRLMRDRHWIAGKQHYVVTVTTVPTDREHPHWSVRGRVERDDDRCPVAE